MTRIKCTYCGGTQFFEGPSGGASTNIMCASAACRHWFNHSPHGLQDLNRVEPSGLEKLAEANRKAQEKRDKIAGYYEEGRVAFEADASVLDMMADCTKSFPQWSDIYRMCGFIDALAERKWSDKA